MTYGLTGVCHPVFRRPPSLINKLAFGPTFMMNFDGKPSILNNFGEFSAKPTLFEENLRKKAPCLGNLGPKSHPYGWHIPVKSTMYPPPSWS